MDEPYRRTRGEAFAQAVAYLAGLPGAVIAEPGEAAAVVAGLVAPSRDRSVAAILYRTDEIRGDG